ncbi:MAG: sarcosine oxidase subunit delta [Lautropia sp.]
MMQLACPHCGPRPENEFRYGGSSHVVRPTLDCSDEEWSAYLFFRENPPGLGAERWCHVFGCGQWFNALRDATTHEVQAIYGMTDPAPPAGGVHR